jgi:transposase-like protein
MAIKGRRSTPEERVRAVQLLKEGNDAAMVARMFQVSRAMLFRWQQKYNDGGPAALETKKTRGPASRKYSEIVWLLEVSVQVRS